MPTKKTPAITPNVNTRDSLQRKRSKKFYQTKTWKNLRSNKKNKDRKVDIDRVVEFYESQSNISSFDLSRFMDSDMPMCAECERNGMLTPAYYLDHIDRIRTGGNRTDEDNLQWLCKKCDAIKRSEEGRE